MTALLYFEPHFWHFDIFFRPFRVWFWWFLCRLSVGLGAFFSVFLLFFCCFLLWGLLLWGFLLWGFLVLFFAFYVFVELIFRDFEKAAAADGAGAAAVRERARRSRQPVREAWQWPNDYDEYEKGFHGKPAKVSLVEESLHNQIEWRYVFFMIVPLAPAAFDKLALLPFIFFMISWNRIKIDQKLISSWDPLYFFYISYLTRFITACLFSRKIHYVLSAVDRLIDWLNFQFFTVWVWSFDWLHLIINGSTIWLIDWLIDPLINCTIDRSIDWSIDWSTDRFLVDWLVVWLIDCWTDRFLVYWLIDWLIDMQRLKSSLLCYSEILVGCFFLSLVSPPALLQFFFVRFVF